MLSIVRGGPRVLFLKGDRNAIAELLANRFSVTIHTFQNALDCAGEGQTIVALYGKEKDGRREFRVVPSPADEVLAALFNANPGFLESVRILPRLLVFRIFGEKERVLEQMEKDFGAKRGRLRSVLARSGKTGIAVCFTYAPLNGPIAMADVQDDVLYVENTSYEELYILLRNRALWYFSEGLENREWNEMEIRIYDSWGYFMEHYERLRIVLSALDAGMILGEGWGKDFAHILMPIQIYRLRFFTFFSSQIVKEMLMGLEYAEDGSRLADLDLYSGREKISWSGLKEKKNRREHSGEIFRNKLFLRLPENDRKRLLETEQKLLWLRKH